MPYFRRSLLILALSCLLAGCETTSSTPTAQAPPSAAKTESADCDAFHSRVWAQTVFDADPSESAGLDPDGDGLACEDLDPGVAPALWTDKVPANAVPVDLAEITDGDTIQVEVDGTREPVRLIGVDAPEAGGPYQDVECFGHESSEFLTGLLGRDGRLFIEKDREERDPYRRLLRWVWLDTGEGEVYLVNEALVRAGYAERFRDTPNRRYVDEILAAEEFAARHELGLWRACDDRGRPG
jgi:micrococcal nuclease